MTRKKQGVWRVSRDVDAAYLYFGPPRGKGCVSRTIAVNKNVYIDIGHDGALLGIEVLDTRLIPQEAEQRYLDRRAGRMG